jgi:hypothetical protein
MSTTMLQVAENNLRNVQPLGRVRDMTSCHSPAVYHHDCASTHGNLRASLGLLLRPARR